MKTFLIMLGIEMFLKWLRAQDRSKNILLNNLFRAQCVNDLENIAKAQTTKDVLSDMINHAAQERIGDMTNKLIGRLLK